MQLGAALALKAAGARARAQGAGTAPPARLPLPIQETEAEAVRPLRRRALLVAWRGGRQAAPSAFRDFGVWGS